MFADVKTSKDGSDRQDITFSSHSRRTSLSDSEAFACSDFLSELTGKKIRSNIIPCLSARDHAK
jgi:hypothetical protein